MLTAISHRMMGFVVISVSGEQSRRFINLAIKSGIRFWHYHREGEHYQISVSIRDYRCLRTIKKRCPVKIKLIKKCGMPFRLSPFKKRPGLLLGLAFAVALCFFLSDHVWMVTVSGEGVYTEQMILDTAREAGVFAGAGRKDFDSGMVANKLMKALPSLEWASVNTESCRAEIAVKYSVQKPEIVEENSVQNLVAAKSGVIKQVEANDGVPRVEINEAVKKGDLLVTGIWDTNERKAEWLRTDVVDIFMKPARGRVWAETQRTFEVQLPKTETLYDEGESYSRFTLEAFTLKLPFVPTLVGDGSYVKREKEEFLYLLGEKLPLSIKTETLTRMYPREVTIEQPEAQKRLLKLLEAKKLEVTAEGNQILSEEKVVFSEKNGYYIAKLSCTCLEDIAVPKQVVLK